MTPIYKFYLNSTEVNPIYKDELAKEWELESNQRFYRAKLSGKISFIRQDYDYINNMPFDTEFLFIIQTSTNGGVSWSEYFVGKFMKTDCQWNADDKKITVQPDTYDEYNDVLAGLEKEYNLISLAPAITPVQFRKRPLIQIYIPGDSVVSCFLGGTYWEQDANAVNDRNALINTYKFALCNLLKEINVTTNGTPNVNGLYVGRMSVTGTNIFTGNLYPDNANGYYINASQVYEPPYWGVITYKIVRSSDNKILFRYTTTNWGNQPFDNADFDFTAVADSGATGTARGKMATYSIYARYLLDVTTISGLNTYPLPPDDIVENNRNYRRAIGYAIDVAFISNNSTATPTEWGIRDNGTYFLPPYSFYGQIFYPIARSTWRYASIWFGFSLFDWILEEDGRKLYALRDSNPLSSVISVVLKQFAPGITHKPTPEYSQFLYATNNPITYNQFDLVITQKSNVLHGDYDRPAQKAPITLQQITNMLRDCFRCFWYIENGKFKIEHISWFRNGGAYGAAIVDIDLTKAINLPNGKNWDFSTSAWDFDKLDMPERYQFAWMDDVTKGFEGVPMEVVSKYVTAGKIENINVSNFTTDVDYMVLNPGAISEDGFALFAAMWLTIMERDSHMGYPIMTDGFYINNSNGALTALNGWSASDYIQVVGGQKYKIDYSYQYAWYDSNKTFISRPINTGGYYFAPTNAAYLRVSCATTDVRYIDVKAYLLPFSKYTNNGVEYILQNGVLSWINLQPTYYIYDLPARIVKINGNDTFAIGIERKKKQTITYPTITDPNPIKLIKTGLGTGQIEKISINLCSRMNKIVVKHDTE